jgi:hypothetical protein
MSKQDKDRAETADAAELAAESVMSEAEAQTLPLAVQTEPASGQTEQSLMFNSWLDRALPRLMEYLGAGPSSAVTSPGNKAKH